MPIDRRTFVLGTCLAATTTTFTALGMSAVSSPVAPLAAAADSVEAFTFKIHGWDDEAEDGATRQVWIGLNRQWRAAWR